MVHALLFIATFHAVLWLSLGVLTALEPPHPKRLPPLEVPPDREVPSDRAVDDEVWSIRPAA